MTHRQASQDRTRPRQIMRKTRNYEISGPSYRDSPLAQPLRKQMSVWGNPSESGPSSRPDDTAASPMNFFANIHDCGSLRLFGSPPCEPMTILAPGLDTPVERTCPCAPTYNNRIARLRERSHISRTDVPAHLPIEPQICRTASIMTWTDPIRSATERGVLPVQPPRRVARHIISEQSQRLERRRSAFRRN